MKKPKLSFLMAAHNEEKIIGRTLENLSHLPYNNYEVLIGLDGCTDNTEAIVKSFKDKFKSLKYFKLNLRSGKPDVIDYLIKKSSGNIIIVNDADWLFTIQDRKIFDRFISVFSDEKIGGISESFPVEWESKKLERANLTYKMVAYSAFLWMKFQKKNLAKPAKGLLYVKNPTMFLTNIFRKDLYKKNITLGDDFERTKHIFKEGYDLVIFPQEYAPRMIAVYNQIKFKDFFKQKIRTAMARKQLNKSKRMETSLKSYYIPSVWFIFLNSWKISISMGFLISFWIIITSLATFLSSFKSLDTKKGWTLRATR